MKLSELLGQELQVNFYDVEEKLPKDNSINILLVHHSQVPMLNENCLANEYRFIIGNFCNGKFYHNLDVYPYSSKITHWSDITNLYWLTKIDKIEK